MKLALVRQSAQESRKMITSFQTWIRTQAQRNDPVGRFARDFGGDDRAPEGIWRANWLDHLMIRNADMAAMVAFEDAWNEYSVLFLEKYR
ncbi:YozE family protein [Paraburkholderia sp. J41]|uniref:YozE family protein n=1 Tax=Paraburkholderia sp. J41 TaxID=2805433 RepID=UPI002AC31111|nr:YozE family protein [Paraburkholderia sp. J41]